MIGRALRPPPPTMVNLISRERSRRTRRKARGVRRTVIRFPILGLCLFGWAASALLLYGLPLRSAGASAMLLGVGLLAGLIYLGRVDPETPRNLTRLGLFLSIALPLQGLVRGAWHLVDRGVLPPDLAEALLPLSLAPLLGCLLVGSPFAIVLGLWVAYAASVMAGNGFPLLVLGMAETAAAVQLARHARRRSRIVQAGLAIGLVKALVVIILAVSAGKTGPAFALHAAAALGGSLAAALGALLLLPLFESLFGLTTDVRLLELSDPGHPLLQRLAEEAPGTYHHSLMLANLAQAAADEIGANALMVRVCAFFHDIGKLTKPEYFTENAPHGRSPHDGLSPAMSTLIITSHIKEGIGLARHYKLPRPIRDAIQQHHGTSRVSFFFDRARRMNAEGKGGGSEPLEEDFRYNGPKPNSREMAILALADAVEAASRSLDKPTPSRIENLVEEILWQRLQDGQLDQAALTFHELARIRRRFVFSLTNMMHGRVAYPRYEHPNREPATNPSPEPNPVSGPGGTPAGAGVAPAGGMGNGNGAARE